MMTGQQTTASLPLEPEKVDDITRRINLNITDKALAEHKNKKLQKLQKTARVDGFRKGKTPLSVVERMYGQSVISEAVGDLCWKAWQEAVENGNLKPLGQPKFSFPETNSDSPLKAQKGINFSASYEVMPEIVLGDYSSINIKKEEASVSDADIETTIANILENAMHWHTVERPSLKGDAVVADVVYSLIEDIEGKENNEQRHKNEKLVLSDDFAIPELLTSLIGARAGDQINCEANLTENYHNPDWRGKRAKFTVDVLSVEHPHTPELDADFAKKMGISESEPDPVAAFRAQLRKNLSFELQAAIRKKFRDRLLREVVNKTDIPVPTAMEDYCNRVIRRQLAERYLNKEQLQKYGNEPENLLPAENFAEQAKQEAATSILIEEIERQRNITVDDKEIRVVAEELSIQYAEPEKFVDALLQEKQSAEQCKRRAIEDKIIRWLEAQVNVTILESTYNEVLEPENPNPTNGSDASNSNTTEGTQN